MHLLDVVVGEVEQTEFQHVADGPCVGELLQVVEAQIENLQGLAYLGGGHLFPVVAQLAGRDALVAGQVEGLYVGQLIVEVGQASELGTVVELQVGEGSHRIP